MLKDKHFILLILIISFTQGIFALSGILSLTQTRLITEVLIVLLLIKTLFKKLTIKFPAKWLLVAFIFTSALSGLINDKYIIEILLFIRKYTIYYLFFVAVLNSNFQAEDYRLLLNVILLFLILQIPVTIIKFLIFGITEQVMIGTLDPTAGSLPGIYPMAIVSFSLAMFFYKRLTLTQLTLIIAISFVFGIVGAKRASIIFVIIGIFIITLLFFAKEKRVTKFLKTIPLIVILTVVIFYTGIRLAPSLNPENKIWGTFNLKYAVDYYESYSNRSTYGAKGSGRYEAIGASFEVLTRDKNLWFGKGAGDLVLSKYSSFKKKGENFKYNLGYGIRTGFLQVLIQTGVLGAFFFLSIYFRMLLNLYWIYRRSNFNDEFYLGVFGVAFTFLIDMLFYSEVSINSLGFVIPAMVLFAIAYKLELESRSAYE